MRTPATPSMISEHFARAGSLGGKSGSKHDKRRAGHARAAQMFRKMAAKAVKAGDDTQAADLIKRAMKQEQLAK